MVKKYITLGGRKASAKTLLARGYVSNPRRKKFPRQQRYYKIARATRIPKLAAMKGPFGDTLDTKFTYGTKFDLVSSYGSAPYNTFRANGCYDPDFSGGGAATQPRYFDTLCGLDSGSAPYEQYLVKGFSYKITFINANASGNSIGYVYARIRTGTSDQITSADYTAIMEIPNTEYKLIGTHDSGQGVRELHGGGSIGKLLGIKDIMDAETLKLTYNALPGSDEAVWLDIGYMPLVNTEVTITMKVVMEITYYVQLSELNLADPS